MHTKPQTFITDRLAATFKRYQLYHNIIRPHEALDGKTLAEACGIQIQGENKWKTLIENASKKK